MNLKQIENEALHLIESERAESPCVRLVVASNFQLEVA
ncbi:hypothetical protein MNBD_GAMMA18-1615, partial [hydrothermal vent metagenome]